MRLLSVFFFLKLFTFSPSTPPLPFWQLTVCSMHPCLCYYVFSLLFKDCIYLFLEREEGREKEERNINVWLLLMHPHWGPGLQPRHVPWLGIEPMTLWFAGWHSIHWATPARLFVNLFCSLDSTYSEIIWYLPFSDWFISLSLIFSRCLKVSRGKRIFFFMVK